MKSRVVLSLCLTMIAYAQEGGVNTASRHSTGIGFTLISTNLDRGGGGFGAEYYYTYSELFRIGVKGEYGFYGYEYRGVQNVQSNSLSLFSSLRCFVADDVYADIDAGIYREGSDIMREKSGVLNNRFVYALGCGYAIHYSPKISALIGVQSLFVRGKDVDSIVERQFTVRIGLMFRMQ